MRAARKRANPPEGTPPLQKDTNAGMRLDKRGRPSILELMPQCSKEAKERQRAGIRG